MEVSLGKLLLSSLKARKPEYDLEIETSLLIFSHHSSFHVQNKQRSYLAVRAGIPTPV